MIKLKVKVRTKGAQDGKEDDDERVMSKNGHADDDEDEDLMKTREKKKSGGSCEYLYEGEGSDIEGEKG